MEVSNLKLVCIGGGTGLSVMLRKLKDIFPDVTAVVTVADDGGGSGVLRNDLKMLPPGDIRQCIIALSETEPFMKELLMYRFNEGTLKGQSFGNLFIAAMNGLYGNFETVRPHNSREHYPYCFKGIKLDKNKIKQLSNQDSSMHRTTYDTFRENLINLLEEKQNKPF